MPVGLVKPYQDKTLSNMYILRYKIRGMTWGTVVKKLPNCLKKSLFWELWEAPWSSFSICMYEAPLDELHESPWCFAKLFYGAFPGSFSRVLHESPGKIYKALFRVTSWGSCRVFSCEALLEVPHEEPGGFIKFRLRMLYEGPQECFMKQQGKKKVMNLVITFLMNIPISANAFQTDTEMDQLQLNKTFTLDIDKNNRISMEVKANSVRTYWPKLLSARCPLSVATT